MTKSEILTKILTNRINTEKVKGTIDFTEIINSMDVLLAGGSILTEQYEALTELIDWTNTTQ